MSEEFRPRKQLHAEGVRFNISDEDISLIGLVVTRFMEFLKGRGVLPTETHARNLHMDLGACHSNGCPLDFAALLAMDLTPFVEDCMNIGKNLDRTTGRLMNFYRPRCARSVLLAH